VEINTEITLKILIDKRFWVSVWQYGHLVSVPTNLPQLGQ
jgi:hypothetical protein